LQKQKKNLEGKISLMTKDDTSLSRNQKAVLGLFDEKPELSSPEIAAQLGMNIETTKKNLKALVKKGYLIKHGATKGAWYSRLR
ncbi:MAG: winged helix-turn-helix domain-containing protein, partial [Treponema sp.]|nr:winged helix-turn-helix domain-containing protein [Treponema sp.]